MKSSLVKKQNSLILVHVDGIPFHLETKSNLGLLLRSQQINYQ